MVTKPDQPTRSRKWTDLLQFGLLIGLLIVANLVASQFPVQLDLTAEKRYTISPATKELLRNLDDVVYVEVYLEGEFPAGFKRLQKAIKEKLDQFRGYAGGNLEYKFVNPSAQKDAKSRNDLYQLLGKKGIQPTNLVATEDDKQVEKIIFPGAVVSYGDREAAVMLLKGNSTAPPNQRLNQSVEGVEYELAAAIKRVAKKSAKKVAILEGQGEIDPVRISDLVLGMQRDYEVQRIRLADRPNLNGFDAIVIAKPDSAFTEPDKFKIDQFIIHGGKALFFIDPMRAHLDSIGEKGTYSFPYNLNLDDLLFKYGVRLNADLVQDLYSGQIPMVTGYIGDQLQTSLVSWRFYPVINTFTNHPIARNMDMVLLRFASTIDTVRAPGIRKTPLMLTSKYARILPSPVRLNFNEARIEPNPKAFNKGPLPMAYLLEGRFQSLYTNRLAPESVKELNFVPQDKESRIVVVPDGDFVRSELDKRTRQPFELGYDRFMKVKFANREFALNALDYLLDETGLLTVRSKEVLLRPLDRVKIKEERGRWQLLNLVVPVLLVVIYGLVRYYLRKKKYEQVPA